MTSEIDMGLDHIAKLVQVTWNPGSRVVLPIGYFANVIDLGLPEGIAICTDGVGSKSIIADKMGKYDTIGIDCVAMNVNDLICVGATPVSLVDYIAVDHADAVMLDAVVAGLCEGANEAEISIAGGEIAQLADSVRGFDLVGAAFGRVDLNKVLTGKDIVNGDVVVGVRSSGVHSNGLTMARRILFDMHGYSVDTKFDELGMTLGEELLRPTDIYVCEALEILKALPVKALINITGDGLLNLGRVEAEMGFEIHTLIEPHPIFQLIQERGKVEDAEMFETFNMGTGFCYVVDPEDASLLVEILKNHGRQAQRIGYAMPDPERHVYISERKLVGQHKRFRKVN